MTSFSVKDNFSGERFAGGQEFCPIRSAIADPDGQLQLEALSLFSLDNSGSHSAREELISELLHFESYNSLIASAVGSFIKVSPYDYCNGQGNFGSNFGSLSVVDQSVFDCLQLTILECVERLVASGIVHQLADRDYELIALIKKVTDYGTNYGFGREALGLTELVSATSNKLPDELVKRLQVAIGLGNPENSGIAVRRLILGELSKIAQRVVELEVATKKESELDRDLVGRLIGIAAIGARFRSDTELLVVNVKGEVLGVTARFSSRANNLLTLLNEEWRDINERIVAARRDFDRDIRELSSNGYIVPPSNGVIIKVCENGFSALSGVTGSSKADGNNIGEDVVEEYIDSHLYSKVLAGIITEVRLVRELELGYERFSGIPGVSIDGFNIIQPGPYKGYELYSSVTSAKEIDAEFRALRELGRSHSGTDADQAELPLIWSLANRVVAAIAKQGAQFVPGLSEGPYANNIHIESLTCLDTSSKDGANKVDKLWELAVESRSLSQAMGALGITKRCIKAISLDSSCNGQEIEIDFLCFFDSAVGRLVWIKP